MGTCFLREDEVERFPRALREHSSVISLCTTGRLEVKDARSIQLVSVHSCIILVTECELPKAAAFSFYSSRHQRREKALMVVDANCQLAQSSVNWEEGLWVYLWRIYLDCIH